MWAIEALVLIVGFLLIAGAPWGRGGRRTTQILIGILTAGTLALLLLDRHRWQLVPLYAVALLGLLLALLRLRRGYQKRRWWRRGLRWTGASLLLVVALLPLLLFPLFDLPAPRGPYAVGVADIHLVDRTRRDPFFGGPRELMVRAWYPSDAREGGTPLSYISNDLADALVGGATPTFVLSHLPLIGTSGRSGLPVAQSGRLPVIVFVPGFRSFVSQSTALAQDLASQGYVVLSVGAPGDASAVEFPDGRVLTFRRERLLQDEAGISAMQAAMTEQDPARMVQHARETIRGMPNADQSLRLQTADARFVLDRIAQGGLGPLDGRLDPDRTGVMGMSLGGAVAGQVCLEDARCRAGANLDGFQFGDLLQREIGKPFMMVSGDYQRGPLINDAMYRAPVRPAGAPPVVTLQVAGARHLDFTDVTLAMPLLKHWIRNPVLGPVEGERMIGLTSAIVLGFFDEQLRGRTGALDRAVRAWPEVMRHQPRLPQGSRP